MTEPRMRPTVERPLETVAEQVHVAPARIRYYVRIGLLTPSRVEGRRVYFGEWRWLGCARSDGSMMTSASTGPGSRWRSVSSTRSTDCARHADDEEARVNTSKLTEKAQEAIVAAQRLAEDRHNTQLEPEHLLFALVSQEDGVVPAVLERLEVPPQARPRRARAGARRFRARLRPDPDLGVEPVPPRLRRCRD